VANIPAPITCTVEMAEQHPELAIAYLKGMIKVGRRANEHKRAAHTAAFLPLEDNTHMGPGPMCGHLSLVQCSSWAARSHS